MADPLAELHARYNPPNFANECMALGYAKAFFGEPVTDACQRAIDAPECTCGARLPGVDTRPKYEQVPELTEREFAFIDDAVGFTNRHKTTAQSSWREFLTACLRLAASEAALSALGTNRGMVRGRLYREPASSWAALLTAVTDDTTLTDEERQRVLILANYGFVYATRKRAVPRMPTTASVAMRELLARESASVPEW